jgi:hypothetical protein
MKRIGVISAAALFLLFGNTARSYAQQEHQEDTKAPKEEPKAKPEKQQETKQEAKPEKQQETKQEAKPAKQQEEAKPQKQQEQPKTEKQQQETKSTKQEQQTKGAKQEEHAKAGERQPVQRTAEAQKRQSEHPALRLSVRGSGRIPDDRFRANFGQEHVFVINEPVIVGGFSRFQYGGFWFGFVNPWPAEWYYTDNVYVDFIDGGYYLCNPYYPGARVSISVVI